MRGKSIVFVAAALGLLALFPQTEFAQEPQRARDLGVPFEGAPGPRDAITDVKGVEVGYTTLISGSGKLIVGQGPVRTGVTAVLPRGKAFKDPVFAGFFSQNGNGEMTGIHWVKESGFLEGPIMVTNTHSVGVVRDAVIAWEVRHGATQYPWSLPVVAETWDGWLNDINGFHVRPEDAWHAIETAASGPVAEGNVGGGTGMICFGFKGGTGTASRVLPASEGGYTVGVLVQCNTGSRSELRIGGVAVGRHVRFPKPYTQLGGPEQGLPGADTGSIIIVIATDAPLVSKELDRLCKRATLGLGRVGGTSGDGSGDLFVSFSTANPRADPARGQAAKTAAGATAPVDVRMLPNWAMDSLFNATIEATEEAIINAMVAARTMKGIDDHTVHALPRQLLEQLMHEKHAPAPW